MSNQIHCDLETFSRCDLKSCGGHRYAADASTEILCIGLALNDEEPVIYVPDAANRFFGGYDYDDFDRAVAILKLMSHRDTLCYAHNSTGFEVPHFDLLFEKQTGFKPPAHHQWRCTAAMARRAALPPSLEKCAEALKLGQKKDTRGKALIRKFCIPQKDGRRILPSDEPDAFKELCEYCGQDVRTERAVHKALSHFELTGFALETFQLDLAINVRGFPVNTNAVRNALQIVDGELSKAQDDFKELTGLSINQQSKIIQWLKERGYERDDLRSGTLDEVLEDIEFDPTTEVGQALTLRKRASFAALKKLKAMLGCAIPHTERVCGTLTYHGAGTGRWSGSLVQPQNFKRPSMSLLDGANPKGAGFDDADDMIGWLTKSAYADVNAGCSTEHLRDVYGPPMEVLASSIRHFIHDSSGRKLLDADYSAIEARIMAWLAQEEWRMEVFRTHGRIYEASACQMFHLRMDQITRPIRQKGKIAELALQFLGGVGALENMGALKMGLTVEELPDIVEAWRAANPAIVQYWWDMQDAATEAVLSRGKMVTSVRNIKFYMAQTAGLPYLFMVLPSKRKLAYPSPRLERNVMWTDEEGNKHRLIAPTNQQIADIKKVDPKAWVRDGLTCWGRIPGKATWGRVGLSAGLLAENAVQAVAADIMAHGAIQAERAGYEVCLLVHDEAAALYYPERGQTLDEFVAKLTDLPAWAEGLPVKAEGAIIDYYQK